MRLVKIDAYENGTHDNQIGGLSRVPEGWAVIPEDMVCENFPFGELTAEEIEGVMTVTSWTPGIIPEAEPISNPKASMEERITALEEALNMILSREKETTYGN